MYQNEVVSISDKGAVRGPHYPNWNGYVEAYFPAHGVDAKEKPVLRKAMHGRGRPSPGLIALLKRKPPKLAAVALATRQPALRGS
jgi:hypothetical protein